ncbi:MAG: substrate-binding domain-containing protein [Anaerolineae bacterium]
METRNYTIGFSNLSEEHPYAVTVRESLQHAVAEHPNLQLVVRDNAKDDDRAIANAQEFAAIPVDLAMIYHLGERVGPTISSALLKKGIKIIAIDIPIPPWAIYYGVNNQLAGGMVGEALGNWINQHWNGQVDKVLVLTESRVLDFVRQRLSSAVDKMVSVLGFTPHDIMYLDAGNDRLPSADAVNNIMQRWNDVQRIAIIGFNDETALGALDAARALGRESHVVVVGQGGNLAPIELSNPKSRLIASTAYFPESYGPRLVKLALQMLNNEKVAREQFNDHICLARDNVLGVN